MAAGPETAPLVPLIVGVTGHRDLRDGDVPALEARVEDVLGALRARYPATPLIILTSLAEGSDRLVARVALRLRDTDPSMIRVIAPLPMPRAFYERDFCPADAAESVSLREFRELLGRMDHWFELPIPPGSREEDIAVRGPARARQYERAGAFVAAHCQVLLALWDGRPAQKIGGTSKVVEFALHGLPQEYAPLRKPLDEVEATPVYHILTPRRSHADAPPRPMTAHLLMPSRFADDGQPGEETLRDAEDLYDRIFERMDAFNRDARRHERRLQHLRLQSRRGILGDSPEEDFNAGVRALLPGYTMSDALAILFRRKTDSARLSLFALAFVTALSLGSYAHLGHWAPYLLAYSALLLVTGFLYFWAAPVEMPAALRLALGARGARACWGRRGDFQNKAQDYRALAEGLRVQIFWRLAGVADSVTDHYMLKQKSELNWIRVALRNWLFLADRRGSPAGEGRAGDLRLVLERWVEDQEAFFRRAAARDRAELKRHSHFGRWSLAVGTLSVVALAVSFNFPVPWRRWLTASLTARHDMGHGILVAAILGLLLLAALLYAYAEEKALEDHVKQYLRMRSIFARTRDRLRQMLDAEDVEGAQRLMLHLGQEALAENGDWVMLHRSRPLEIHA